MRSLPRWFRPLLYLLPERFRAAHSEEMCHLVDSYTEGRPSVLRALMWMRAGLDVVVVGVGLRVGMMRHGGGERSMIEAILQDLYFAARALRRRPGFTLVAVATLAVGIGANTAIFSVVNGVLLNPLPYAAADRIGIVWHEFGEGAQNLPALHISDLRDYRERSRVFEDFTVATGREWIIGAADDPEIVSVGVVESGFFDFFGAVPELGREFQPAEDVAGAPLVVMLSNRLWRTRFGSDPDIVGRSIDVAGTTTEVVGVLPESFRLQLPEEAFLLTDAELWTNLRLDDSRLPPRNFTGYTGFGRIREGATFAQAQAEMEVMEEQLRSEHPEHAASKLEARVVPLLDDVVKNAESMLFLLLGAVGFVLVIACANVANLVIVRGQGRGAEYSLRAALGAGRGSLIRLSLLESALLSLGGAVVGGMIAVGSLELLARLGPGSVPRLDAVEIDSAVMLFTGALTVFSAALFGLLPAMRSSSGDVGQMLTSDARMTGGRRQRRFRDLLIIGEVAASLVLLVGTGLMVRSFAALTTVAPGYHTDGILTLRVSLPVPGFQDGEARQTFRAEFLEQVGALPSVEGVGFISQLPLTGAGSLAPFAYNEETALNWESVSADQRYVTPGFFGAMGAEIIQGRPFLSSDLVDGSTSIIIDDRLAELAFPGENAVGRALQIRPNETDERFRYGHVVGVVSHLRLHDVSRPHLTQIYFPNGAAARFSVVVRTTGDPSDLVAPVREVLAELAPGAPMEDVRPMSELVDASLAPNRLALALMTAFGLIALLLACVGVYGVLSYAVAQRTREIGVRMALGQSPGEIRRVVMVEGGRLVLGAVVIGLLAAALLSRAASSLLFGVEPMDPVTYGVTSLVLLAAATLACWVPAHRATRVDPLAALRAE